MEDLIRRLRLINKIKRILKGENLCLTMNECVILYTIREGLTSGYQVSRYLDMDGPYVLKQISTLINKGYVTREGSTLSTTGAGVRVLDDLREKIGINLGGYNE